ncbi:hypothetical protein PSPO01_07841 [Paraphaeosphaeria sporulosa]
MALLVLVAFVTSSFPPSSVFCWKSNSNHIPCSTSLTQVNVNFLTRRNGPVIYKLLCNFHNHGVWQASWWQQIP